MKYQTITNYIIFMKKTEFIEIINRNMHLANTISYSEEINRDHIQQIVDKCTHDNLTQCSQDYQGIKISLLGAILIFMGKDLDQELLEKILIKDLY